jgi:hypothetical protein
MKLRNSLVFNALIGSAFALAVTACSDSTTPKTDEQQAAPASSQSAAPGHPLNPAQQAAVDAAQGMPKQGTVLEMMHAAGYTYMHVDTGSGEPLWIAATMMRVKPQQQVQWTDAAVMQNFASKSLHRTFDQILFVSNASVVE